MRLAFLIVPFLAACGIQSEVVNFKIEYLDNKTPESFIGRINETPYRSEHYALIMELPKALRVGVGCERLNTLSLDPDILVRSRFDYKGMAQELYAYTYVGYKESYSLDGEGDEGVSLYCHEQKLVLIRFFGGEGEKYYGDKSYIYKGIWFY